MVHKLYQESLGNFLENFHGGKEVQKEGKLSTIHPGETTSQERVNTR